MSDDEHQKQDILEITHRITGRTCGDSRIESYKSNESSARAERKIVQTLFTLLYELRKDLTRENAVALIAGEPDAFFEISNKKKYPAAGDFIENMKSHISKEGTPETKLLLEDLDMFPIFLQQKGMIMAMYDLCEK